MTRSGSSRPIATFSFALVLALVLAACGSQDGSPSPSTAIIPEETPTAAPTASPTAAPAPSPTPAPSIDVAKPFLGIFASGRFAANSKVTGTLTVGSASYPITGTYDVDGTENRESVTIAIPGSPDVTSSVTSAGITYTQKGGLWYVKPAAPSTAAADGTLASAMRSVLDVADVGIETRDGQSLHHLQPRTPAGIPLSTFGVSDPTGDGKVSIDFYARADGTPVIMSLGMTWTQVSGTTKAPASMTLAYTFSNVGVPIVISAPEQVWTTYTSKQYGYTIAYPNDWEVTPSPKKGKADTFYSAQDTGVVVLRDASRGASLNAWVSAYIKSIKSVAKLTVQSNKPSTVRGTKARQLDWTGSYHGVREWHTDVLVVKGKYVYVVDYESLAALTPADHALFDAFVSTVDLP